MPFNLTPNGTPAYASGEFGNALNSSSGYCANPFPINGVWMLEAWVKTSVTGALQVAAGANGTGWIGNNKGMAEARYGFTANGKTEITLTTTINIADGAWHHLRLFVNANGGRFFVDGVGANGNTTTPDAAGMKYDAILGVGTFGGVGGFDWGGLVDEVALFSTTPANDNVFTPPTSAYANNTAGLVALWHFEGNLNDSAGAAAAVLPGAPIIGLTTAGAATGAVTFTPGTAGTNPTTSYVATASTGETATGSASPIAFGSLSVGVARTIHVQAISSDGTGPASAESNSITPSASTDTTPPILTGTVSLGTPGSTSIPISYPAGADNVAVVGYETSIDGGATYVSVGNTTTPVIAGLTPGTAYPALRVRAFDAAALRSTPYIASPAGFTTAPSFTASVNWSPGNWGFGPNFAQAVNPGAWFEFVATGSGATLNFDVSGLVQPFPQITWRADRHGPIYSTPIAAAVVLSPASDTSDYADKGGHFYEVLFKSASENGGGTLGFSRWGPQQAALRLTGITTDANKVLSKPAADTRGSMLGASDSIFETVRSVNATAANDTDRNDAGQGFMLELANQLGLRYGNIGFGGTGYTVSGSGGVPALPSTIGYIYSGMSRTMPPDLELFVLGPGINDGGNNVQNNCTTILNYLLGVMPAAAKIAIMRPLNGGHESELQAAIAACSNPSRCGYIDTTGVFRQADSYEGLHPYGPENIRIARMLATPIRAFWKGSPTLNARTVSFTLRNAAGPMANLTSLQVSIFDDPTRAVGSPIRYQTVTGATDANGVFTTSYQSTLASGGTCGVDVRGTNLNMAINTTVS